VQNWHRPLGRDQLRRRYARRRHATVGVVAHGGIIGPDPAAEEAFEQLFEWPDERDAHSREGFSDVWNGNPYFAWPFGSRQFSYRFSAEGFFQLFLNELRPARPPLFPPAWATNCHPGDEDPAFRPVADAPDLAPIEVRLERFIRMLTQIPGEVAPLREMIIEAIGDHRNSGAIEAAAARARTDDFARTVLLFAPFWVRQPRDGAPTDPDGLLRHLFVKYPVPAFLVEQWYTTTSDRNHRLARLKWMCWLILMGQGGSLARAGTALGWTAPRGLQTLLLDMPGGRSPNEACCEAVLRRLGGDDRDVRRILRNEALVFDPTTEFVEWSDQVFWEATARWMITNREAMSDADADAILAWAVHEHTEAQRHGAVPFSWSGRGVRATLARSLDYQRRAYRPDGHGPLERLKWQHHGWDRVIAAGAAGTWSFVELTSSDELSLEGRAMHHCVSSYAGSCAAGGSAIFSMQRDGRRVLTVEVTPATKRIVQMRGACNRPATHTEKEVISQWARAVFGEGK